ncbi:MAG TPA: hypothetical protein VF970_04625 [Gemmatimonadales bacterium]
MICVIGTACAASGPYRLRTPAPADQNEVFFCVVAAMTQHGYRVERRDRAAGVVRGRAIRPRGRTSRGDPRYDELAVTLLHDPAGDFLLITADDRGHAQEIAQRCGKPS